MRQWAGLGNGYLCETGVQNTRIVIVIFTLGDGIYFAIARSYFYLYHINDLIGIL